MVRLQSCTKMHKPLYIAYILNPLSGPSLGGAMPNAVLFLYKTCSVLYNVLDQPRTDNSRAGSNIGSNWSHWL